MIVNPFFSQPPALLRCDGYPARSRRITVRPYGVLLPSAVRIFYHQIPVAADCRRTSAYAYFLPGCHAFRICAFRIYEFFVCRPLPHTDGL